MAIATTGVRYWLHGSEMTWDADAKAAYLNVKAQRADADVARTVEMDPGWLMVDVDADGRILGVEVLGHPIDLSDLLLVLRWCVLR